MFNVPGTSRRCIAPATSTAVVTSNQFTTKNNESIRIHEFYLIITSTELLICCAKYSRQNVYLAVHVVEPRVELTITDIVSKGLEPLADHLFSFHHNKRDNHRQDDDAPLDSIHRAHSEQDGVESRDVRNQNLNDNQRNDGHTSRIYCP